MFTFKVSCIKIIILKKLEGLTWNANAIRMSKKQYLQTGDCSNLKSRSKLFSQCDQVLSVFWRIKIEKIKGCLIHRRILKNRPPPEEPEVDLYKLPLMKSTSAQRQSIHSINGAIGNNNKNKEIQRAVRSW